MANEKQISVNEETGSDVYCIILQEATERLMDNADGEFKAASGMDLADYGVTVSEDSIIKGLFVLNEDRKPWADGWYTVTCYKREGALRDISKDTSKSGRMYIVQDLEQSIATMVSNPFVLPTMTGRVYTVTAFQNREVEIVSNDTPRLTFSLEDDYTGWTAYFGAKEKESDVFYKIPEKQCSWSDVTQGTGYVDLTASDTNRTGVLYGEIVLISGVQKLTAIRFKLNFRKGILRQ